MWSDIKGKGVRVFEPMAGRTRKVEMLPLSHDSGAFIYAHIEPHSQPPHSEIFAIEPRAVVVHMIKRLRASGCTSPSFTAYD
jgi:hypothetical protein